MINFRYWSPDINLHRWYFIDGSYIEAKRHNAFHVFKISASDEDVIAFGEMETQDHIQLMESIKRVTHIDLTL